MNFYRQKTHRSYTFKHIQQGANMKGKIELKFVLIRLPKIYGRKVIGILIDGTEKPSIMLGQSHCLEFWDVHNPDDGSEIVGNIIASTPEFEEFAHKYNEED